jgi:hypothetical protein
MMGTGLGPLRDTFQNNKSARNKWIATGYTPPPTSRLVFADLAMLVLGRGLHSSTI